MSFTVKALDGVEQKGSQRQEQDLLDKHEKEQQEQQQQQQQESNEERLKKEEIEKRQQAPELKDEDIIPYINKRFGKQINSLDELVAARAEAEELPADVAAFLKYKKETGRSIDDFNNLRKDFDTMDPDKLLKEYTAATNEGLDDDDVDVLMNEYRYDESSDSESDIKNAQIKKKRALVEAKKFFNSQKEKYNVPLESSGPVISAEEKEELDRFRNFIKEGKTTEEVNAKKRQYFEQKTTELFSKEFKGFKFKIGDKELTYSTGSPDEIKKAQATPSNFINKFLDAESGLIKDPEGYHRSLAMAMNPDAYAKYFYEQGLADATDGTMRKIKNIDMSDRKVPEQQKSLAEIQVKAVNPDAGKSLVIRSRNKK